MPDWVALPLCVAAVCTILGLMIYAGEIGEAVKKWRERR